MTGVTASPAVQVPDLLASEHDVPVRQDGEAPREWLGALLKQRHRFGITRIGSLTQLDRTGVPVVQVTRPLALSNAVSQGKGLDMASAAASGLMETIETWAAERIPPAAIRISAPSALGKDWIELYAPWVSREAQADWASLSLPMIEGWDMMSAAPLAVPQASVDTVYTFPSPHPPVFPRVTTGLGAGTSLTAAILQAGLEVLERHALVRTYRTPYFHERFQVDLSTFRATPAASLLHRIQKAGFVVAAWRASEAHALPVYRCHVMEAEWPLELAPMPAEGSACRFTHDNAFLAALLEACQARSAVIAGAREDITRQMYPPSHKRQHLAEWREQMRMPGALPHPANQFQDQAPAMRLQVLIEALKQAGARAVLVVPLFMDRALKIHVVRLVAPPLHLWPGGRHE